MDTNIDLNMDFICTRCGVTHHSNYGIQSIDGRLFCRNSEQCIRRRGPDYSRSKAITLSIGAEVARKLMPTGYRAIYQSPDGFLYSIGIRPPKKPHGLIWSKYKIQRYVRNPKVLWFASELIPYSSKS